MINKMNIINTINKVHRINKESKINTINNVNKIVTINKRGQGVQKVIAGVIVLVVLIVVVVAVVKYDLISKINNVIPWFGQDDKKVEGVEIVRYNIQEGSVEYYTGEEWVLVKEGEGVDLGEREVDGRLLKEDLADNYYFSNSFREAERIELGFSLRDDIYSEDFNEGLFKQTGTTLPLLDAYIVNIVKTPNKPDDGGILAKFNNWRFDAENYKRGDVLIELISKKGFGSGDDKIYGEFILRFDNSLSLRMIRADLLRLQLGSQPISSSFSDDVKKIGDSALKWRDSVLEKPVNIRYKDKDDNLENDWYCVEKIPEGLVVRLDESVNENAKCKDGKKI